MADPFVVPTRSLRPLPRIVTPVLNETLVSYLSRLSHANRLDASALRCYATGDRRRSVRMPIERLAILADQPSHVLGYAILELCTPDQLAGMHVTGRPKPGGQARIACRHCTASRGHHDVVWTWQRHEDILCQQHRRWTGGGHGPFTGAAHQPDLSRQPDILTANRRHRALIRTHGRRVVLAAYRQASYIGSRWRERRQHGDDIDRLLTLFHRGPNWQIRTGDPTIAAASYPQTVALTGLLTDRTWRARAVEPDPDNYVTDTVRHTVAPSYRWVLSRSHGIYDPLVEVVLGEHHRDRAPDSTDYHEDTATETIGTETA